MPEITKFIDLVVALVVLYSIIYCFILGWGALFEVAIFLSIGFGIYHMLKINRKRTGNNRPILILALIWAAAVVAFAYITYPMLPIPALPPGLIVDPPPSFVFESRVLYGVIPSLLLLINMAIDVLYVEHSKSNRSIFL